MTSVWLPSPKKPVECLPLPAKPWQHKNRVTFISDICKMSTKAREKSQVTNTLSQYNILSPGETSHSPFFTLKPQQICSRATAGSWSSSDMLGESCENIILPQSSKVPVNTLVLFQEWSCLGSATNLLLEVRRGIEMHFKDINTELSVKTSAHIFPITADTSMVCSLELPLLLRRVKKREKPKIWCPRNLCNELKPNLNSALHADGLFNVWQSSMLL